VVCPFADEAGAVHRETTEPLHRDVTMFVAALQERTVDGADRPYPWVARPPAKVTAGPRGDADVEEPPATPLKTLVPVPEGIAVVITTKSSRSLAIPVTASPKTCPGAGRSPLARFAGVGS
jgi:hypothetical protein